MRPNAVVALSLAVLAVSAAPAFSDSVAASITASKTHQSESVSANMSSSMVLGHGIFSSSLSLNDSAGSGIDYASVNLSYQGMLGRSPKSSWNYNLGYELDSFVNAGATSETLSGGLGYRWVTESGFSSGVNLSYANKENLHGQTHETKSLSISTSKTIKGWRLSVSASYGINDSSAAPLDRFGSGSISAGRALTDKTYLSLSASQSNTHQRHYYDDTPYDIWMESRGYGLSLSHQLSPAMSASMSIRRSNSKTEYFGSLVDQNDTTWSLSTTYRF